MASNGTPASKAPKALSFDEQMKAMQAELDKESSEI